MMRRALVIHVPMKFQRRGGRKIIVAPNGNTLSTLARRSGIDNVLVKALARAFRWQKMLERGSDGSIKELAEREGVDKSYVGYVLRLNLLAPDVAEMILDGLQPPALQFNKLRKPFPVEWCAQRRTIVTDA
jgi:hypothetical protein